MIDAPYIVKDCDQVLMINAQRISNIDDYTSRTPAFFTMSAYLINMFDKNDTNTLIHSINIGHIKVVPDVLPGSSTCIDYADDASGNHIQMCLPDLLIVQQIKDAYDQFMKCRMGGSMQEFNPLVINNVLQASCKIRI